MDNRVQLLFIFMTWKGMIQFANAGGIRMLL